MWLQWTLCTYIGQSLHHYTYCDTCCKISIGAYGLSHIVSRLNCTTKTVTLELHTKNRYTGTMLRLTLRNKSGYNNNFCTSKAVTRTHLQNNDKFNGIAQRDSVSAPLHMNATCCWFYSWCWCIYVSQVLMFSIRYGRKLCFWQRIRLWNRHKNLTEALGPNGKSFHESTFRHFGQIKTISTSSTTFCWTDS